MNPSEGNELQKIAEGQVNHILTELPSELRLLAESVAIHYQQRPNPDMVEEFGNDLLGLFSGEAHDEIGQTLLPIPPQIHLFINNLWEEADRDMEHFKEEIRITYLHELGHYLGWDEQEIENRGLG